MSKYDCLIHAIAITKEFAGGSKTGSIDSVLEGVYTMLIKLAEETKK